MPMSGTLMMVTAYQWQRAGRFVFGCQSVEKRFVMVFLERMIGMGIAAVVALVVAMPVVHAEALKERHAREGRRQGGGQSQQQSRNPHEAQRPYAKRSEGSDEQRTQRLTPEERRQLRRDIKDAGSEIYPPRR
jgi:hypothetical protein